MNLKHIVYCVFLFFLFSCQSQDLDTTVQKNDSNIKLNALDLDKLKTKAKSAFLFSKKNQFDTNTCILIDLSIHSGLERFFVWDFQKDSIVQRCLVSHGCGNYPWSQDFSKEKPTFSNQDGSHCSSIGKYKLENRSYSNWGVHVKYNMYGLDSTNSNAFKRAIVFHSWEEVSNSITYPNGTPEGWGCPAISNEQFEKVDSMLKQTNKPVLMWIFAN